MNISSFVVDLTCNLSQDDIASFSEFLTRLTLFSQELFTSSKIRKLTVYSLFYVHSSTLEHSIEYRHMFRKIKISVSCNANGSVNIVCNKRDKLATKYIIDIAAAAAATMCCILNDT